MKRTEIMIVAGEPSGDANAADLVRALAEMIPAAQFEITPDVQPLTTPLAPRFFGAGGPKMAAAGVELAFDLTADAAIGIGGLLTKIPKFLRQRNELLRWAAGRQPDAIILVDYGGFNLSLARVIRKYVRGCAGPFFNWEPKIVQFTSPQVWASRPWRAKSLARNFDLVLSLFPFEKQWYAARVPNLCVEFVGHPIFDRFPNRGDPGVQRGLESQPPRIVLLPGSRRGELQRHIPVMCEAARLLAARQPVQFKMIAPDERTAALTKKLLTPSSPPIDIQCGGLAEALSTATLAITKSGTIALECAYFGVPSVTLYKPGWITYLPGRALATVKYLSMPNLLADEPIYPEFIQGQATPGNVAAAALDLLANANRRAEVRVKLAQVIQSLGTPGAIPRAAAAIVKLLNRPNSA